MPANARFAEASLRVDPDSLKKFFAGHGRYLTVFVSVSKPQQTGSVSPTKFVSASRRRNAAPSREAGLSNQHASRVCSVHSLGHVHPAYLRTSSVIFIGQKCG